ncbi:MAG: hypothetical protein U5L08_07775 [Xanthomonadales bacterium]|nr:hypothetical protein [Xanthomonadales bacterium]
MLEFIERAISANASSSQASAVLADFINTAARRLADLNDQDAAEKLFIEARDFLLDQSPAESDQTDRALERLELLTDQKVDAEEARGDVAPAEANAEALSSRAEAEELRVPLAQSNEETESLARKNSALEKSNEELQLQLHLLREQVERKSTSLDQLTGLILRLEERLEQLRLDWENSQGKQALAPTPKPSSPRRISGETLPLRSRIIVVGQSRAAESHLAGICKHMGIDKDQVDFRLGYNAFDSLDINSRSTTHSVAGILIGPVPHKVPGQDDPVQALMRGEGYPPTVRVETNSGELKITKSSFRDALENLLTRIASLEPSLH